MAWKWKSKRKMISSSSLANPQTTLILDASVVINLNATNQAPEIIGASACKMLVTTNAIDELESGMWNGHDDVKLLRELMSKGLIFPVALGEDSFDVYEALIDGNASSTLDDGEAATIAYASAIKGIAVIDEKKARRICKESFPGLRLLSSADLLLDNVVLGALGPEGQAESIYSALVSARMRIPEETQQLVVNLIGEKRAAKCISLPRSIRMPRILAGSSIN